MSYASCSHVSHSESELAAWSVVPLQFPGPPGAAGEPPIPMAESFTGAYSIAFGRLGGR